ncbi:MAG: hypothetical protein E7503_08075 [Ruminococcus sp.]|nr:hypothetical protein [Ruminococcus sp.]
MTTQFWWVFDTVLVLLAVFFIYSNAKRGVTKVLVMCIGYIVATVASSLLSTVAAPALYEVMARDSNLEACDDVNREFDPAKVLTDTINAQNYGMDMDLAKTEAFLLPPDTAQFIPNLYQHVVRKSGYEPVTEVRFHYLMQESFAEGYCKVLLDNLPDYAAANFREKLAQDTTIMYTIIENMYSSTMSARSAAAFVEDTFVKESTIEVFRIYAYLILFSIIMVFAALIASMLEHRLFFNLYRSTEHVLGGFIGLIEAGMMTVLMTILTRLAILLGGGTFLFFNEETVMASKLFSFLYERLNIML